MSKAEQQRQAETAEQIRAFVHRHCHALSVHEIAEILGVSPRVVDLYYPRASR